MLLIPDKSGERVFILLETNNNVDHAGHSELQKYFQIDLPLMEKMLSCLLKIWLNATTKTWDAMVVIFFKHGSTCSKQAV